MMKEQRARVLPGALVIDFGFVIALIEILSRACTECEVLSTTEWSLACDHGLYVLLALRLFGFNFFFWPFFFLNTVEFTFIFSVFILLKQIIKKFTDS